MQSLLGRWYFIPILWIMKLGLINNKHFTSGHWAVSNLGNLISKLIFLERYYPDSSTLSQMPVFNSFLWLGSLRETKYSRTIWFHSQIGYKLKAKNEHRRKTNKSS